MGDEEEILRTYQNVVMVGLSSNPERPSNVVASYLREHGYRVIPVNPKETQVLGERSYPDLTWVPDTIEVVDIFRRSGEVMPIVEDAIKLGARAVWMQEGVINEEAAARARRAGLLVVMDRCMRKEHVRLSGKTHKEG